jgi:activator of 2-hydroxyglutaryl-CoA dehydratase
MKHENLNTEETANSDLGVVSGSSLSEAILIIENLMAYGRIYTVKGVRYVEGSHEEILDKAEEWLNKVRKNYR